ncbi:carbon-nitrogen hydrolase family protein [Pseudomonas abieticivorans]|uniref:carbon-nitrogen hydrolase family protein n=1 Tax=Pseudomonas abieticivorans TaxID=2931382 RepID=UPI0020C147E3|nr:carbon-nitrogen hydrolase family protein [Pseudomonas sp. PIA16]
MLIALYQCAPLPLDVGGNLQRMAHAAHQAASQGVDLLVFPEMFLSGYNIGHEAASRLAEPADGESARYVAQLARANDLAIIYGYPERGPEGGLYNAAQIIDARGQRLANYRKTHLFGELDHAMFSPGQAASPVVELGGWRIGLLICYDLEFPESARQLALAGADLIVVPTANMTPYEFVAQITMRSRAYENQCYVAYANYAGAEGDIHYCGLSSVAGPQGSWASQTATAQGLLLATLDPVALATSRRATPYLQDRRPDFYE